MRNYEWRDLTPPPLEDIDIEAARKLAYEAAMDFGFHEVALISAFEAEAQYIELGKKLVDILGYPSGMRIYAPVDE